MTREEYKYLTDWLKRVDSVIDDLHGSAAGDRLLLLRWLNDCDVSENTDVILLQGEYCDPVVMKPGLYRRETT